MSDLASKLLEGSDDAQNLHGKVKVPRIDDALSTGAHAGSSSAFAAPAVATLPCLQPLVGQLGQQPGGFPAEQQQMQQLLSVVLNQQQQMNQMMGYITAHMAQTSSASNTTSQQPAEHPGEGAGAILASSAPVPKVEEKLAPEIISHIKKVARSFAKTTNKYIYAASMERKMQERLEVMKDETRYPPGVKAFSAPVELLELGTQLEEAVDNEYAVTIRFPRGITRKDAMQKLHHHTAVFNMTMYQRAYQERVGTLKPAVTHDQFLLACNTPDDKSDTKEIDLLGLEAPTKLKLPNTVKAREMAEAQYAQIMSRLQEKLKKQKEATEEASNERKQSQEALESADVEQLLPVIIRNVVRNELKSKSKKELAFSMDTDSGDEPLDDNIKTYHAAMSKNGSPPEGNGAVKNLPTNPKPKKKLLAPKASAQPKEVAQAPAPVSNGKGTGEGNWNSWGKNNNWTGWRSWSAQNRKTKSQGKNGGKQRSASKGAAGSKRNAKGEKSGKGGK